MPFRLFLLSSLAILAAATPTPTPDACTTSQIQCCEQVVPAGSSTVAPVLKALDIVVQDVTALVGLTCSPITVVGVGAGDSCSAQTVCCENNAVGGLVSIGCVPIIL
ncbi:fungal hydrophobin-domain-containing protein [Daedaleopsis nitida]|nr:fungal hydrophobin-domain-containing protein [Daedaleopsis nitida]